MAPGDDFGLGVACGAGSVIGILLFLLALLKSPWGKAFLGGSGVPMAQIIGMRLRGSPVSLLIETHLALLHSGIASDIRQVESAWIANRHRIIQPSDLFDIVKRRLEEQQAAAPGESPFK